MSQDTQAVTMPERTQVIPRGWQNFMLCLCLHVALPLLPLGLEKWFSGRVEPKSAALTAALYSMAIGLSSRSIALFGVGVLMSFLFSAAFGFLSIKPELEAADTLAYFAIAVIVLFHGIERFNRHVIDQNPFFEFSS